jgi:uncharacterized repeat protein (TIGR01451 family)
MKLKRYFYWIAVVMIVGALSGLWLLDQSNADDPDPKGDNKLFLPFVTTDSSATNANFVTAETIQIAQGTSGGGRIDAFTFYIPYNSNNMAAQFNAGSNTPQIVDTLSIETIISIAVNQDGAVVYYDQWEDGLEADLTLRTQFSTLVWGDGDPTNNSTGVAGVQPVGIPANDILTSGTIITLRDIVPNVGRGTPPAIYFDGGDALTSLGGAVAVSTSFWTAPQDIPNGIPGILFTDAWELYPTNRWGMDYIIPIGQNVNRDGPGNRGEFQVVGLNVQAVENATQVIVDLNDDGIAEYTQPLDQGEQLSLLSGVLAGTRVRASGPVQVQLFASDPDSTWEARGFTEVPFEQWTNDYLAPRASDGDFWLYNPGGSPLVITVQPAAGPPTTITIPARGTARYLATAPPFDDNNADDTDMSGVTGLRFTSVGGGVFYGIASLDTADAQDWGYDLLPVANLTTQTLVGLGLGNNNSPPGPGNGGTGLELRVYVSAITNTTVFVDYDNDGVADAQFPVPALQEVAITDPTDFDMTGAFLFTQDGTPFAAAWGQDESATVALPSIDAGTSIVPLRSLTLQKTFTLLTDVDCTGTISVGDAVRFQLDYINDSATLLTTVTVSDTLPTALTYITNTTTQNSAPVADNSGPSPYPLDGTGLNAGSLTGFSSGVLTYDANVNNSSAVIINRASANSPSLPLQGDAVTIFVPTGSITPLLQITETLIDPVSGPINVGQVVTFNLTITNTGSTTITSLPLEETFNASDLTFRSSTPAPDITSTGVITWTDLTTTLGDLLPNSTVSLTLSFTVNQVPATGNTTLVATVRDALRQNSPVPLTCSSNASLGLGSPTPTPTPTPTATPTSPSSSCDDCGGNGKRDTPTPTPITVAVVPAPSPAVVPPVNFLPETGLRDISAATEMVIGGTLLLAFGSLIVFLRFRRKN